MVRQSATEFRTPAHHSRRPVPLTSIQTHSVLPKLAFGDAPGNAEHTPFVAVSWSTPRSMAYAIPTAGYATGSHAVDEHLVPFLPQRRDELGSVAQDEGEVEVRLLRRVVDEAEGHVHDPFGHLLVPDEAQADHRGDRFRQAVEGPNVAEPHPSAARARRVFASRDSSWVERSTSASLPCSRKRLIHRCAH